VITFHQQLAPDEHYYSYIAGLYQKSGWNEPQDFLKATVTSAGLCADSRSYSGFSTQLFPNVLRALIGTVIDLDQFRPDTLNILTLLPYYRPFLVQIQQQNLFKEAAFTYGSNSDRRRCLPQLSGTSFRYCVTCMSAAFKTYGRAVLLRSHQLPCVFVCWEHRTPLRTVDIDTDNLVIPDFQLPREKCVQRVSEELLWLAAESRKLLHLNRGFTSPVEKIHAMYSFEQWNFECDGKPDFSLRECEKRKKSNDKGKSLWNVSWPKSLDVAFETEINSMSDELREAYATPWRGNYKRLGKMRTGKVLSPIEHLMRIRRFAGGVEEFFKKVDEVSLNKLTTFFPFSQARREHGVILCPTAVTWEAANFLRKVDENIRKVDKNVKPGLGGAMEMVCNQYRDHVARTGLLAVDVSPTKGMARDVAVSIPLSLDNFTFIDRLAAWNGTGKFSETVSLILERVQQISC